MTAQKRLLELGISLPEEPAPGGNYLSAKTVGGLLYLAGVISKNAAGVITGTAGADRTVAEGYAAARACCLTQLAVLKQTLGSLDKVQRNCQREWIRERRRGVPGLTRGHQRSI